MLSRFTRIFVFIFEELLPDAYVFALMLTLLGAGLAYSLAPHADAMTIVSGWYGGVFNIFTFAFQMVMMLATGYALATSPLIQKGLGKIASLASTPRFA